MKNTPDIPKIGNGLVQLKRMDKSTRQMWVNNILVLQIHIQNKGRKIKKW